MTLVRPRLNDYYGLTFTQEEVDFAIPLLDEDIPLYIDPFLLWKSPSQQDQALHAMLVSSFNHFGLMAKNGYENKASNALVCSSECNEVGLGSSSKKIGKRIGKDAAQEILSLFKRIPQVDRGGFLHIEEIQLYVEQISRDRISDITCNLLKSFLVDFTIDQCTRLRIPMEVVKLHDVFNYQRKEFKTEDTLLPIHPNAKAPVLLVPKRWLRYSPWIGYDDYFDSAYVKDGTLPMDRVSVLQFNRQNYDVVQSYIRQKELTSESCKNDPLFKQIPVISAKRKMGEIKKLPSGKKDNADKNYEKSVCQLLTSLFYPQLDFADEQSRTDSGVLIRDLIFYNNRSTDFLKDIYDAYGSRQIVFELKNVHEIEREHIFQLNRYLNDQFGRFGIIVTRNPLPASVLRNTIDLWSGQRRCIIVLTDSDLELMVSVFESKQRLPIEVLKRCYINFSRECPS